MSKISNPNLIAVLDAVAEVITTSNDITPIHHDSSTSPMLDWWTYIETQHNTIPTVWSSLITLLDKDTSFVNDANDDLELSTAVSCFPGFRARMRYMYLQGVCDSSDVPNYTGTDSIKAHSLDDAHKNMLSNLSIYDQNFFNTMDALELPWYSRWMEYRSLQRVTSNVTLPDGLNKGFEV